MGSVGEAGTRWNSAERWNSAKRPSGATTTFGDRHRAMPRLNRGKCQH
jgi:hypothetical protein